MGKKFVLAGLRLGIDAHEAIMSCADGMSVVGEKCERRGYFIPYLPLSSDAIYAMNLLIPHISIRYI